jgi:hypothetical protein
MHIYMDLTCFLDDCDKISKAAHGCAAIDLTENTEANIEALQDAFSNGVQPLEAVASLLRKIFTVISFDSDSGQVCSGCKIAPVIL